MAIITIDALLGVPLLLDSIGKSPNLYFVKFSLLIAAYCIIARLSAISLCLCVNCIALGYFVARLTLVIFKF